MSLFNRENAPKPPMLPAPAMRPIRDPSGPPPFPPRPAAPIPRSERVAQAEAYVESLEAEVGFLKSQVANLEKELGVSQGIAADLRQNIHIVTMERDKFQRKCITMHTRLLDSSAMILAAMQDPIEDNTAASEAPATPVRQSSFSAEEVVSGFGMRVKDTATGAELKLNDILATPDTTVDTEPKSITELLRKLDEEQFQTPYNRLGGLRKDSAHD